MVSEKKIQPESTKSEVGNRISMRSQELPEICWRIAEIKY